MNGLDLYKCTRQIYGSDCPHGSLIIGRKYCKLLSRPRASSRQIHKSLDRAADHDGQSVLQYKHKCLKMAVHEMSYHPGMHVACTYISCREYQ